MSAVVKEKSIETIYDHNVTDAEILVMTDGYPETKDEYFYALSQDSAYADLYRLYIIRNDPAKADYFVAQITEKAFRDQIKMRPCCAVHS
jgi:hypothetical protein